MEPIELQQLAGWCGGADNGATGTDRITGVSTDTRSIRPGELFIPLVGENFDGHDYIKQALDNGAAAFLSSREVPEDLKQYRAIKVNDTLKAYQQIAHHYRKRFPIPVVAITGSNGKTTTKDITAHVLGESFKVLATEKNFNNEVGIPRTLMQLDSSCQVVVIELAMRGLGQIRELAEIVEPDVGVITNIGENHFELLGSYEAIAQAKCELLENLNPAGTAILNADDKWYEYSVSRAPGRITAFGIGKPAGVQLVQKENRGLDGYLLTIRIDDATYPFELPILGIHNIYNALAAITIAHTLGMGHEAIARGLKTVQSSDKRLQIHRTPGGWMIINDTYNASPSSTRMALEILRELEVPGRKIAVLADMLELGDIAVEAHRGIGMLVKDIGAAELHVLGDLGKEIAEGARQQGMQAGTVKWWEDKSTLIDHLKKSLRKEDVVLVKGSRRMKMEEIVEGLA